MNLFEFGWKNCNLRQDFWLTIPISRSKSKLWNNTRQKVPFFINVHDVENYIFFALSLEITVSSILHIWTFTVEIDPLVERKIAVMPKRINLTQKRFSKYQHSPQYSTK